MPVILGPVAHGLPGTVELAAPDPHALMPFYADVLGWRFVEHDGPLPPEATAMVDGVPAADFTREAHPAGPGGAGAGSAAQWRVYFQVDDIDSLPDRVAAGGGAVLSPPASRADGSRGMLCRDPAGARVGFRSAADGRDPHVRAEPGALSWLELLAEDYEATFEFYEEAAALTTSTVPMGDGQPAYTLFFATGNDVVAGAWPPPAPAAGARWRVYFAVADLAVAAARADERGGVVGDVAAGNGMGRWAVITDPAGAEFSLLEPE